jgi:hypothetical protein
MQNVVESDGVFDFEFRPTPKDVLKVSLAVVFDKCLPNFAGFKWETNHVPLYYRRDFQQAFNSKLVAVKFLPFISRVIKEDLYKNNRWLQGSENFTTDKSVFKSNF